MKRSIASLAVSACLVVLLAVAPPAGAAGFVSFVSDDGEDTGSCGTLATACRQITFALGQTNEGGIIHVLPGEYIAFAPDKSIEIVADAGQASIFTTTVSDAGIAVNVSGTKAVRLRGFRISAAHGILINGGGGVVHIENCTILPAETKTGIVYAPTGASELYVSDTTISGSGSANAGGILIKPVGGSAKVVLDNVSVDDNSTGITVDGRTTTGTNTVTIRNSTVAGSSTYGILGIDSGGGLTNVIVEGSTSTSNGSVGLAANGANVTIRVRNSTVTGNGAGLSAPNSGKLISHGGNVVAGNTVNGAFTQTIGQQ